MRKSICGEAVFCLENLYGYWKRWPTIRKN